MEIEVDDNEVIRILHEFLLSRKLYVTADALEKESCLQTANAQADDQLLPLREFAIAGKWGEARQYLHVLSEIIDENTHKQLVYLLFRQRFCELCFGPDDVNVEIALKDIVEELHSYCSEAEYETLMDSVYSYYDLQTKKQTTASLVLATRLECFHEISQLILPILSSHGLQSHSLGSKNERLISIIAKGFLYERSVNYCLERANNPTSSYHEATYLNTENFLATTSLSNVGDAIQPLLCDIPDSRFFQQLITKQHKDVLVKNKPLSRKAIEIVPSPSVSPEKANLNHKDSPAVSFSQPHQSTTFKPEKSLQQQIADSAKGGHQQNADSAKGLNSQNAAHQINEDFVEVSNTVLPQGGDFQRASMQQNEVLKASVTQSTTSTKYIHEKGDFQQKLASNESHEQNAQTAPDDRVTSTQLGQLSSKTGNGTIHVAPQSQTASDTRDSYADFIAEQSAAKLQRDQLLKELQRKEAEAKMIRENLQVSSRDIAVIQEHIPPAVQVPKFQLKYVPIERTDDVSAIRAVSFHPFGEVYAVGSNSQTLKICAMPKTPLDPSTRHSGKYPSEMGHDLDWSRVIMKKTHVHKGSIYSLAWNGSGDILASCSNDKLIKLYRYDTNINQITHGALELGYHKGVVRDLTFVDDFASGSVLASCGSGEFLVYAFDCATSTLMYELTGHCDQILSICSWNNGMMASSSQDGSVRIWDLKAPRCVSVLGFGDSPCSPSVPTSVCVDKRGKYLVAGRADDVISLYDITAGKVLKDLRIHNGEVRSVQFNPESANLLLSGSYDGSAAVTDIHQATQDDPSFFSTRCAFHKDKVIQCRWHPSGRHFASTSADRSCVLWTSAH